jgi:adenine-specific DNA-methyltransferase
MSRSTSLFDLFGRNSRLYDRYTTNAEAQLSSDGELEAARDQWVQFFVESNGNVFDRLPFDDPRTRLFIETLYYDFVVDQIIQFAEKAVGFTLANPESGSNTDALSIRFRSLHRSIVNTDGVEQEVAETLTRVNLTDRGPSFLRGLYENIVSREIRLALGEYYTPRGVADLAVQTLDVADFASETFLDPGCGSGVFLSACIDATRAALDRSPDELLDVITETIYGIDLNPVAVKSAKLGYLLSVLPLLAAADTDRVELPVFLTDALELTRTDTIQYGGSTFDPTVDHLVGNPPWITWGNLSESIRDAWRETYVEPLDLLAHEGIEMRLGYGNDDISLPFVLVCMYKYLDECGDASFVLKRTATKGPAGRLLRTQRVGSRQVAVRQVHDFNRLKPFGDSVDVDAAIYTFQSDSDPQFPIPTSSWTAGTTTPEFSSAEQIEKTLAHDATGLVPVDDEDPASSWIRSDAEYLALGECEHEIRHGVKDDAKDVYSVDANLLDELEHDHIYPYLRSKHVVKYGLFGHDRHLVPLDSANQDNEEELQTNCPRTYDYLESNRERLDNRSSSWLDGGAFYNVFGLGEYTWSEYKVVWCRLGFKPHFAVVSTVDDEILGEKTVVPGDHCMFISTDNRYEAHFLCGLLNSSPYQQSLDGIASQGKSSLSKTVVSRLELPQYHETAKQEELAELSMTAHEIVPRHTDTSKRKYNQTNIQELSVVQASIDALVEEMLSDRSV